MPEGWAWCKLKELSLDMADGPFGSNLKTEHYTTKKEARLIQLSNIGEYGWREENTKYTTFEHARNNISRSIVEPGNIVIAKMMPAGRAIICPNHEKMYVLSSDAVKLVPTRLINLNYLLNAINSPFFRASVTDNVQGTTRLRTSISKLRECYFPLPPLDEQCLIVSIIEKSFFQIDILDNEKSDLEVAIKQAKSKILDLAIHGKLVPQDPNDEPAEKLLKRIATSDNRPYKKLAEDIVPYFIPTNWIWSRFGDYIDVRDGTHYSPKYVEKGYPFVTSKNLVNGKIDFSNVKYISEKDHKDFSQRSFVDNDDILFAMIGSIGNPVLVKKDREFSIKNVALFKPFVREETYMKYVLYFLIWIQEELRKQAKGGMQPFVPLSYFRQDICIPIPPLKEQYRIVTKIEELFSYLDTISSSLE